MTEDIMARAANNLRFFRLASGLTQRTSVDRFD
jgi:hypothetical protein